MNIIDHATISMTMWNVPFRRAFNVSSTLHVPAIKEKKELGVTHPVRCFFLLNELVG
jgi:hypothetical protein